MAYEPRRDGSSIIQRLLAHLTVGWISLLVVATFLALVSCRYIATPTAKVASPHATPTISPVAAKVTFTGGLSFQHPYPFAYVTFTAGTSYVDALQAITDLGLQPLSPCAGENLGAGVLWHPVGEHDLFAAYPQAPRLWVNGAVSSPDLADESVALAAAPDWLARLSNVPFVAAIADGGTNCPSIGASQPTPGMPYFLTLPVAPTYLSITFVQGTSYEQALDDISNLGFRLADPCYEQTQRQQAAWHPVGQESPFASTSSLIVATTQANSTQWRSQLHASVWVRAVVVPYTPDCTA